MRFLFVAMCAPRPFNQTKGLFVHQMAKAIVSLGHQVDILVPVRVFPTKELTTYILNPLKWFKLSSIFQKWLNEWRNTSSEITLDGVHYIYKRFSTLPHVSRSGKDCAVLAATYNSWLQSRFQSMEYNIVLGHFAETIPLTHHLAKQLECPSGIYIHEDIYAYCHMINKDYLCGNLNKCDFIFTNSRRSKSQLLTLVDGDKQIRVIHLGIDEIFMKMDPEGKKTLAKEIRLVCVSRFTERKNQEILIEAVSIWNRTPRKSTLHLNLVGDDSFYRHTLSQLVNKANLTSCISFTDATNIEAIHNSLQQADIFVFPSKFESFGIVVIEAASQGIPIISSTEIGAVMELELSGFNMNTFDSNSVSSLVNILEDVINNYDKYYELSLDLRQFVIQEYSWENAAGELIKSITE